MIACARGKGRGLRTDDISALMYPPETLGEQAGVTAGTNGRAKKPVQQGFFADSGDEAGTVVRPSRGRSKEYSNKLELEPDGSNYQVPEWYEPIRGFVTEAGLRQVRDLTSDEINCLARYHAYEWAYARKLTQNRAHSRAIGAGIIMLVTRNRAFSDLTVGEYCRYGAKVWEQGGKMPWFRATDIRVFER